MEKWFDRSQPGLGPALPRGRGGDNLLPAGGGGRGEAGGGGGGGGGGVGGLRGEGDSGRLDNVGTLL